jgi:hypothetical protein
LYPLLDQYSSVSTIKRYTSTVSNVGFLDYFIYHLMALVSAFRSMKVGNSKDEYRCLFAFMSAYADLSILICCARSAYPEMPKQSTNFSQAKNRFVGLQLPVSANCGTEALLRIVH